MKLSTIFLILVFIYLLFIFDCKIHINNKLRIEYNGLLWVILDKWTIWRYNSNDQAIPWIKIY